MLLPPIIRLPAELLPFGWTPRLIVNGPFTKSARLSVVAVFVVSPRITLAKFVIVVVPRTPEATPASPARTSVPFRTCVIPVRVLPAPLRIMVPAPPLMSVPRPRLPASVSEPGPATVTRLTPFRSKAPVSVRLSADVTNSPFPISETGLLIEREPPEVPRVLVPFETKIGPVPKAELCPAR